MKLRKKISLILACTLAVFIVALAAASNIIISQGFSEVERSDVEKNVQRAVNAIEREVDRINSTCVDWASWDDTYEFIQDNNAEYLASNLPDETFAIINVNVILYADANGDIVFAKAVDMDSGLEVPLPDGLTASVESVEIWGVADEVTGGMAGIVQLPDGAFMLSSQPILTSLEQGPARGMLLMGRFVDDSLVAQFTDIAQMDISLHLYDDSALNGDLLDARNALLNGSQVYVTPLNNSGIAGYAMLEDVRGRPVLLCRVVLERGIFEQGQISSAYLMATLFAVAALVIVVTGFVVERLVLLRLLKLSRNVDDIGSNANSSKRVAIDGDDEIISLARAINGMLEKIELSMNALNQAKGDMECQVRQAKEICRAMVENIGPERANGLLYDSGWKAAMKEAGPPATASQLSRLRFAESQLSKQSLAIDDKVVVLDFDVEDIKARFMLVPSNGQVEDGSSNPMESYRTGFYAGVVSRAFGRQVGLERQLQKYKGKAAMEFTTRALEPYERSTYTFT